MNKPLMSDPHQPAPWAWQLAPGRATTLAAGAAPRWLLVNDGCVWLTGHHDNEPADDIWLCAGQSLVLPAGTAWVVEGWPQARLSLLAQAPAAVVSACSAGGVSGVLPCLARWWQPAWLRAWAS